MNVALIGSSAIGNWLSQRLDPKSHKNANVAATIALAGIGFDATRVRIVADPKISENIHEREVHGTFDSFKMSIAGVRF
jgi:predicted dinucleotide-utilizing enzyme